MAFDPAIIAQALGGLGQAAAGNATSGGTISPGGIVVGSKVVGSGTAATVPAPQTAAEASVYSAYAGNKTASILNSPNLPIIAVIAGLVLAVLLFVRRK